MTITPCRYPVLRANLCGLFFAGLAAISAACGTEGGNPHRSEKPTAPPPAKKEYDTGGDNPSAPGGSQDSPPAQPLPGEAQDQPDAPVCKLTVTQGTEAGFRFVFQPDPPPPGGPAVEATLSRTSTNPAGGDSVVTKPVGEWSPETGAWQLSVGLVLAGVQQNYCRAAFSLDTTQGTWAGVLLTVTGTE